MQISPLYAIVDPLQIGDGIPPIKCLAFTVGQSEFGIPLSPYLTVVALEANGDLRDVPYFLATYDTSGTDLPVPSDGCSWRLVHEKEYETIDE